MKSYDDPVWRDAVKGLERGDFSRLEPLFDGDKCRVVDWCENGYFEDEPKSLAEALTCACFLGRTSVAAYLLDEDVDPLPGPVPGCQPCTGLRTAGTWTR